MANSSRSSVLLEADPEEAPAREVDSDDPFRILVLGDFSGRRNRKLCETLAGRRPTPIDLDNFDDVMAAIKPTLDLPQGQLSFRELDDFHPDYIYRAAEIFRHLQELRYEPPPAAAAATAAAVPAGSSVLESILDQSTEAPPPTVEEAGDLAAFIRKAIAEHLEARPDPNERQFAARVQEVAGGQMRNILHHPEFQALEGGWRALWMLVHGLADDARIYLLDATLEELVADPAALDRILGGARDPWALLVGNFAFAESQEGALFLQALGAGARRAGAPFLAEAQPPKGTTPPEYWRDLRRSPVAHWIGLVLPRFLLRLPYGKETSPVESFPFEEMEGSVHADYLWGNPAFCCAYLIGQSFRARGWDLRPGMHRQMDGLPLHSYKSGGEMVNKPCAEILLSEKDADFLMEAGYMPLASMKDKDTALLVRFQSIADPPAPLAGRWA